MPDRDECELRAVERLADVEREREALGAPRQQVLETRLVDRDAPGAQVLDPLREDVAHDHLVAEVGETRPGDEADVAGTENGDPGHPPAPVLLAYVFTFVPALPSGCRPFAIASIVSFESESTSVLTTQ